MACSLGDSAHRLNYCANGSFYNKECVDAFNNEGVFDHAARMYFMLVLERG